MYFYTILIRHKFKYLGTYLSPLVDFNNPKYISIKKGTGIRPYTWVYAIISDQQGNRFCPEIEIGHNCSIGRFCHITCSNKVVLEDFVFLTEGVLITDSIHGYTDVNVPIIKQPLISKGSIVIGKGTWIGNGARIVGTVSIGKNCVIAANTLISNISIPDNCVVMGVPGKIVKQYNHDTEQWQKI